MNQIISTLLFHLSFQLRVLDVFKLNFQYYLDYANRYSSKYPFPRVFGITGKLMDSVWEETDPNTLKTEFNGVLGTKTFMLNVILRERKMLIEKTQELISFIDSENY